MKESIVKVILLVVVTTGTVTGAVITSNKQPKNIKLY